MFLAHLIFLLEHMNYLNSAQVLKLCHMLSHLFSIPPLSPQLRNFWVYLYRMWKMANVRYQRIYCKIEVYTPTIPCFNSGEKLCLYQDTLLGATGHYLDAGDRTAEALTKNDYALFFLQASFFLYVESIRKLAAGQPPEGFIENSTGQNPLKAAQSRRKSNL
jgi:hypothetical protein